MKTVAVFKKPIKKGVAKVTNCLVGVSLNTHDESIEQVAALIDETEFKNSYYIIGDSIQRFNFIFLSADELRDKITSLRQEKERIAKADNNTVNKTNEEIIALQKKSNYLTWKIECEEHILSKLKLLNQKIVDLADFENVLGETQAKKLLDALRDLKIQLPQTVAALKDKLIPLIKEIAQQNYGKETLDMQRNAEQLADVLGQFFLPLAVELGEKWQQRYSNFLPKQEENLSEPKVIFFNTIENKSACKKYARKIDNLYYADTEQGMELRKSVSNSVIEVLTRFSAKTKVDEQILHFMIRVYIKKELPGILYMGDDNRCNYMAYTSKPLEALIVAIQQTLAAEYKTNLLNWLEILIKKVKLEHNEAKMNKKTGFTDKGIPQKKNKEFPYLSVNTLFRSQPRGEINHDNSSQGHSYPSVPNFLQLTQCVSLLTTLKGYAPPDIYDRFIERYKEITNQALAKNIEWSSTKITEIYMQLAILEKLISINIELYNPNSNKIYERDDEEEFVPDSHSSGSSDDGNTSNYSASPPSM